MSEHYEKVQTYLLELGIKIVEGNLAEELFVVEDEENGISNLIVDCEAPILVLEQLIMEVPENSGDLYKRLLQMNSDLVHGAYTLSGDGKFVAWRDTLQLANLDLNELEGSIRALSLAMAEHCGELLGYARA
ncbi:YbjN domain-containing protein [Sulfidibacter corallicola]|uniref:YbjN domain-containing protein n=1 Tax=Sulfidibacter corallicola TaxID=2818388 RepID=A0A8A4TG95_SULCO|nr:YbjN domain-containing protein [Sulfidibacter corallicola]QTD47801.1 YbjN domain-containing protein [Sulfidibacter corallicola]